ncbi:hypothetical protein [Pleomorphomonas sp. NRK KF1]|uniref:hypothetical protein n=1 Tax=Pleomorphomonas sp. NRK KF1 TaxID=2943000 RepID=UPI00204452A9|nr:hypothetical protein [Pleomorphomonas sp. NRK KF1]MCM5555115.1 hypothetical protein [Pleomorphomonas sp. NRK KF1]
MKTSLLASLALAAALLPSVASAASLVQFDPAARDNDPQFVAVVHTDGVNAAAAKADAARYAAAEQSVKSGAVIGTHGSEGYGVVTTFDPAARDNDPQFVSAVVVKGSTNAAAAKADAARYAAAEQSLKSGAVVGTHGSQGYSVVTTFDPAARDNEPQFKNTIVLTK